MSESKGSVGKVLPAFGKSVSSSVLCDGDERMTRNLLGPKGMELWEHGIGDGCRNCCEIW